MVAASTPPNSSPSLEQDGASCTSPDGDLENLKPLHAGLLPAAELHARRSSSATPRAARSPTRCSRRRQRIFLPARFRCSFCRICRCARPLCPGTRAAGDAARRRPRRRGAPATRLQGAMDRAADRRRCRRLRRAPHAGVPGRRAARDRTSRCPRAAHAVAPSRQLAAASSSRPIGSIAAQAHRERLCRRRALPICPSLKSPQAKGAGDLFAVFLSGRWRLGRHRQECRSRARRARHSGRGRRFAALFLDRAHAAGAGGRSGSHPALLRVPLAERSARSHRLLARRRCAAFADQSSAGRDAHGRVVLARCLGLDAARGLRVPCRQLGARTVQQVCRCVRKSRKLAVAAAVHLWRR